MKTLISPTEYEDFLKQNDASLIYYSTHQCNVCKALKPKIVDFIKAEFPKIKMAYVDCEALKDVSAQNQIFAVPTIIVYLDEKEFIRKSRNINMVEFQEQLQRPYSLFFDN